MNFKQIQPNGAGGAGGFPYLERTSNYPLSREGQSKGFTRSNSKSNIFTDKKAQEDARSHHSSDRDIMQSKKKFNRTFKTNSRSELNRSKTESQKNKYRDGNAYNQGMKEYLALAQQSLYADENIAANLQFAPDKFKMIFSPMSNANNSVKITPTVSYRLPNKKQEETSDTLAVQ